MVEKRLFESEETFEVSSKHPRQVGLTDRQFSSLESVSSEDVSQIPHTSGEAGFTQCKNGGDKKLISDVIPEHQGRADDFESSGPGCISVSSWPTSSTSEEDSQPVTQLHVPVSSEYFFPERSFWTGCHPRDLYSFLLGYPPRKSVPVGQNHQVDIPAWDSQCTKETSNHIGTSKVESRSEHASGNEDDRVLMGTCVIPMPDFESSEFNDGKIGNGRSECCCEDRGSVRCVRQHVKEAREELREVLGQDKFVELGFLDMGEVVADKWSEAEERLFHKVVYSNPASLGKNFWDLLPDVFPSRTKKDIVSYYFNVFMLRRRAMQNRCYPVNISSDNDEWQESDDSGDNEPGMSDDDDSVVESPAYHDDIDFTGCLEPDLRMYGEVIVEKVFNNNEKADTDFDRGITNVYEDPGKLPNGCGSNPSSPLRDNNNSGDVKGDREFQDDSCTSYDTGAGSQGVQVKTDKDGQWQRGYNELSDGGVPEYALETCDTKVWDAGYTNCHPNKVELLPTCSMIEEVFGDGSWNYKVRDGKSLS